jgi:phenylacetate-CoA ligase
MEKIRYAFGEWLDASVPMTVKDVAAVCQKADSRRQSLRDYPQDKILRVLEKVGKLWSSPEYPHRKRLEAELPGATGFSPEMIRLGMEELVWVLSPEVLRKKVATELKGLTSSGQPSFAYGTRSQLRWSPLGVVLHVLSGNVFLVGVGSLVEGLVTGNVTILKMSSGEKLFLPRLIESLIECDEEGVVARSVALVDYPSSAKEVLEEFKARVDGLVVWGGEDAVRAYRDGLGAGKKLVVFGPKLSLSIVTRAGLAAWGADKVAEKLAWEMSIWDQNACTAPQQCYVEGEAEARAVVEALPKALESQLTKLPAGPVDVNVAVEIQKWRGVAEIAEAKGEGLVRGTKENVDWTVLLDKKLTIEPSPLHRTLRIIPFQSLEQITQEAENIRGYLQTVGLVASTAEQGIYYQKLAAAGALKVGDLGQMSGGEVDDPHDGAYDLPQLGHFVVGRFQGAGLDPIDATEERQREIDGRLRRLIDEARKSEFYGKRLEGVAIDTVADLKKIPALTRNEMEANMPPQSQGLATRKSITGGYVSRSGGSTGEPKFSVYDKHDWEQMIDGAVRLFRAAGMEEGDRVANFMLAGDLYGSFVSFDHINNRLGAMTFAFANHLDPELFVKLWKQFGLNVIQAIPARLVKLLREAKVLCPELKVQKVLFAGTPMSQSDRDWLKTHVGVERISSIIGANDGGQIAFQCEYLTGSLHHTVDDFNWIELVDDQGNPVPDGEPGRILITSLLKYAYPLIRYEIGDAGRFVSHQCPCGRKNRVLEYLGRADDQICVGLINLPYRDIASSLEGFPISAIQLAVREGRRGDEIVLRVETECPSPQLENDMREAVLHKATKVGEGIADGTVAGLYVEAHPLSSLPRNGRSGKLKTVVDERR